MLCQTDMTALSTIIPVILSSCCYVEEASQRHESELQQIQTSLLHLGTKNSAIHQKTDQESESKLIQTCNN